MKTVNITSQFSSIFPHKDAVYKCHCRGSVASVTRSLRRNSNSFSKPFIYGATAPSGPWPPSQDASIHPYFQLFSSILLSPAVVNASLWTTSAHLILGLPNLLPNRLTKMCPPVTVSCTGARLHKFPQFQHLRHNSE